VIAVAVLAAAAAGIVSYSLYRIRAGEHTGVLEVTGTVEATEIETSFKVPGRMVERFVDEGDVVTTGQAIAVLDLSDYTNAVGLYVSRVRAAQVALAELEHGSRPEEIEQGRASLNRARAESVRATRDYERARDLLRDEVISAHEYDAAQSTYVVATATVAEAEATLRLLEIGPRIEEIEKARAALVGARKALAEAQQHLTDARLLSPATGVVLSKQAEPGEYVMAGTPVVSIANLSNVWLRAYINETDLARVKPGQRAVVTTDTYPRQRFEGHVAFIASEAEFTPKTVYTEAQRVKLVYRIKINLSNPTWELKPGMPAVAEIQLQ
jgi:HlyD family secretion protein